MNGRKLWRIEYKTEDGHIEDVSSSWRIRENAERWVEKHIQSMKDEGGTEYGEMIIHKGEVVTTYMDGFNTFTVYSVESVFYS